MIARLEHDSCARINFAGSAKPGPNRLEHRPISRTRRAMKRAIAKCSSHSVGFMSKNNDHLITNRPNRIVRRAHERLRLSRRPPELQLLRTAHPTAAPGGEKNT
jgi:hypothetical protein